MVFLATDYTLFVALLVPYFLLIMSSSGAQFAIAQAVVNSGMRAMSSAALILIMNLAGLGLGPFLVGFISDQIAGVAGADSLRYALVSITPLCFVGAYYFFRSGQHIAGDVSRKDENSPEGQLAY